MRTLLDKTGRWLVIIGLVVIILGLYWKDFAHTGMAGMALLATGCMIVFRRHKSVFNWD
ncbi:hypothetical protein HYT05_00510 [Candidatus Kaiserbacteria bacterium]|nr:hypothetical protein [Candidatus Kaiserbacteria bacterium]